MKNTRPLFTIIAATLCLSLFTQCCGDKHATDINCTGREINLDSLNGIRIAYFDIDTVMYRYNFALDINKETIKKEAKISSTLNAKRRTIEKAIAQFEFRCNTRTFINE